MIDPRYLWFIDSMAHWWLVNWLIDWLIGWLVDWPTDSLIRWFNGLLRLTGSLIQWLIYWLIDSVIYWFINSLNYWFADSLILGYVDSWFIDLLTHYFAHALIHWSIGSLLHWFTESLVHDRLVDSSCDPLIHRFVPTAVPWFIHSSVHWFSPSLVHGLFHAMSLASQPQFCTFVNAPHNTVFASASSKSSYRRSSSYSDSIVVLCFRNSRPGAGRALPSKTIVRFCQPDSEPTEASLEVEWWWFFDLSFLFTICFLLADELLAIWSRLCPRTRSGGAHIVREHALGKRSGVAQTVHKLATRNMRGETRSANSKAI